MFVILTSKEGQFHTEAGDHIKPVEAYDYLFYGQKKAHFVIAELNADTKIRVTDANPPHSVNLVPTKFLEKFETIDRARRELEHLTRFGTMDTKLHRTDS